MSTRLFSEHYDSVYQRKMFDQAKNFERNLAFEILGKLRLDILLYNKIVLTDTQVLDGTLFRYITPSEFYEKLTRTTNDFPVEIKSRENTLAGSLIRILKPTNGAYLKEFVFSIIDDEQERENVSKEITNIKADSLNNWEDIPEIQLKL